MLVQDHLQNIFTGLYNMSENNKENTIEKKVAVLGIWMRKKP